MNEEEKTERIAPVKAKAEARQITATMEIKKAFDKKRGYSYIRLA